MLFSLYRANHFICAMLFSAVLSVILNDGTIVLALPLRQSQQNQINTIVANSMLSRKPFHRYSQPSNVTPQKHKYPVFDTIHKIAPRSFKNRPAWNHRRMGYGVVVRKGAFHHNDLSPTPPFQGISSFNSTNKHNPRSHRTNLSRTGLRRRNTDEFDLDYTPELPTTEPPVSLEPVQDSVADTIVDPDIPPTPETPPSPPDVVDSSNSEIATVIPDNLGFPKTGSSPSYALSRVLYGTGILHYMCRVDGGDPEWMYSSTEAGLYHDIGYTIRIGQVSCNSFSGENPSPGTCIWSIENNGGSITAKLVKSVPAPNALDADWTRSDSLVKGSTSEAGVLRDVRVVFTVATVGGKPPQMIPCNESNAGEKIMVDFKAEYQLYSHL